MVLATKVYFPASDRVNDVGLSRKHILRAIDESLSRLGTDYVDLYQFIAPTWSTRRRNIVSA